MAAPAAPAAAVAPPALRDMTKDDVIKFLRCCPEDSIAASKHIFNYNQLSTAHLALEKGAASVTSAPQKSIGTMGSLFKGMCARDKIKYDHKKFADFIVDGKANKATSLLYTNIDYRAAHQDEILGADNDAFKDPAAATAAAVPATGGNSGTIVNNSGGTTDDDARAKRLREIQQLGEAAGSTFDGSLIGLLSDEEAITLTIYMIKDGRPGAYNGLMATLRSNPDDFPRACKNLVNGIDTTVRTELLKEAKKLDKETLKKWTDDLIDLSKTPYDISKFDDSARAFMEHLQAVHKINFFTCEARVPGFVNRMNKMCSVLFKGDLRSKDGTGTEVRSRHETQLRDLGVQFFFCVIGTESTGIWFQDLTEALLRLALKHYTETSRRALEIGNDIHAAISSLPNSICQYAGITLNGALCRLEYDSTLLDLSPQKIKNAFTREALASAGSITKIRQTLGVGGRRLIKDCLALSFVLRRYANSSISDEDDDANYLAPIRSEIVLARACIDDVIGEQPSIDGWALARKYFTDSGRSDPSITASPRTFTGNENYFRWNCLSAHVSYSQVGTNPQLRDFIMKNTIYGQGSAANTALALMGGKPGAETHSRGPKHQGDPDNRRPRDEALHYCDHHQANVGHTSAQCKLRNLSADQKARKLKEFKKKQEKNKSQKQKKDNKSGGRGQSGDGGNSAAGEAVVP